MRECTERERERERERETHTQEYTTHTHTHVCCWWWCFEPSQPLEIISGLKETFIKRHIVERTNKAEIGLEDRVRKQRVLGRIYGMKYS